MALQIWLPLDGSLTNKGLDAIQPQYVGGLSASTTAVGNITEKVYSWTSDGQAISLPGFMNTLKTYKTYSMCAWVYFTGGATNHPSVICSSGDWNQSANQLCFALYNYSSGYNKILVPNTYGWSDGVDVNTLTPNGWHHVGLTYDGVKTTVYLNGQKVGTYNGGGITATSQTSNLYIGCATYYTGFTIKGRINDFRIYDHCLSGKEMSLVAQGLVAHYLLNNNGERQNLMNNSGNEVTGSAYRVTTYTFDKEGFGRYLNPGEKVTLTICFTPHANFGYWNPHLNEGASGGWMPNIPSDGTTNRQIVSATSLSGWNYTTHPDTTPANSNICMYCKNKDNTVNNAPVTIHWATLQIGNQPSEYWLPSRSDAPSNYNIEYDCSGYGNDGAINGPISLQEGGPRYEHSSVFNGSSTYINCGRKPMVKDAITVSCWGYMDDWTNYSNRRLISCTEGGGWNLEPSGDSSSNGMNFAVGTGTTSNSYHSATSNIIVKNLSPGWHLFTGTYDGFTSKIYIDGELRGSSSTKTTKTPIFYNSSNSIFIGAEASTSATTPGGSYFNGKISDVRIYATALSAEDVKELYNTPISIGKNGAIMGAMFKEV